jgi:hypothetical protein
MKKFYVFVVVFLSFLGSGSAQNYYWIGAANGNWDNAANWSATSGGIAGIDYPRLATDNVILDANATIQLNTTIDLNTLSVTGTSTNVTITAIGGVTRTINAYSTNPASPGLNIAAGCRLVHGATTGTEFIFNFVVDGQGAVNGDWYFTGDIVNNAVAYYMLPTTGAAARLNINNGGSITIGTTAFIAPNEIKGDNFLVFNSGSSLNLMSNGPIIPVANYNANSTINITGVTNASVNFEETGSVGNINYNCAGQSNGAGPLYLSLFFLSVDGNLNVLNTNNQELALLLYSSTSGLPSRDATIKGNLNIQGTSKVAVAHNDGPEIANNLFVQGNVVANGTSFSLHTGSFISTKPTALYVKGNIQHTAGTFNATSAAVNETTDLFLIEMNGTSAQTISSTSGTFDNSNHQVTLRINNSAGVTLLSNLETGRINFNTANKGVLTTNANILTINNTTPASVSGLVVNLPANANLGFVNGNVRRKTLSTEAAVLPAGAGSAYRGVTIIPSAATASTYEAKYFNSAYSDLSVISPLSGVSPDYYWIINRIAGSDAAVQLSVPGAVTGAQSTDGLVVAKYNGADWASIKGATGTAVTPGDATSGTVRSDVQTSFSPFTIGYASQSVLPTLLVSFEAKKAAKETAELKWKITGNSTPSSFDVIRSGDGINFVKIGTESGFVGKLNYEFTDNSILAGNNYYRLKMLDKDGSITYSVIIVVSNGAKGVYINSMMPTMVRDRARLNIYSSVRANMQLVVTDINGRIIQNQAVSINTGNQEIWLNAARLSAGIFQVTGYVNGEKTATFRFIKL